MKRGLELNVDFCQHSQEGETDNAAYEPIMNKLGDVVNQSAPAVELDGLRNLRSLMPSNTEAFYRYSGSLTTPNCNEVVTWTVFRDPVTMSQSQVWPSSSYI